eukprot:SAG22_NODE_2442_length_2566_cov_9.678962_2_plen_310_part_00
MEADKLSRFSRHAALLPPSASEEELAAAEQRLVPQSAEAARLTRAAGQHGKGTGTTFAGIVHVVAALRAVCPEAFDPQRRLTTSDFIKAHIQPVTLPPGWVVEPEVTNAANSWYTHHYFDTATMTKRIKPGGKPDPPPGTYSLCAKLAADPATAHFIGTPTHFLSHAVRVVAADRVAAHCTASRNLKSGVAVAVAVLLPKFCCRCCQRWPAAAAAAAHHELRRDARVDRELREQAAAGGGGRGLLVDRRLLDRPARVPVRAAEHRRQLGGVGTDVPGGDQADGQRRARLVLWTSCAPMHCLRLPAVTSC